MNAGVSGNGALSGPKFVMSWCVEEEEQEEEQEEQKEQEEQ
jgi:hypothetical protein